jgi:hypothetical protein
MVERAKRQKRRRKRKTTREPDSDQEGNSDNSRAPPKKRSKRSEKGKGPASMPTPRRSSSEDDGVEGSEEMSDEIHAKDLASRAILRDFMPSPAESDGEDERDRSDDQAFDSDDEPKPKRVKTAVGHSGRGTAGQSNCPAWKKKTKRDLYLVGLQRIPFCRVESP